MEPVSPAVAGWFFPTESTVGSPESFIHSFNREEAVSHQTVSYWGFPSSTSGKEPTCQCRRCKRLGFNPWVRKIPWRRWWQPTPVFLPGESHGQRSLVGYSQAFPISRLPLRSRRPRALGACAPQRATAWSASGEEGGRCCGEGILQRPSQAFSSLSFIHSSNLSVNFYGPGLLGEIPQPFQLFSQCMKSLRSLTATVMAFPELSSCLWSILSSLNLSLHWTRPSLPWCPSCCPHQSPSLTGLLLLWDLVAHFWFWLWSESGIWERLEPAAGGWEPFYYFYLEFVPGPLSTHLTGALLTAETCWWTWPSALWPDPLCSLTYQGIFHLNHNEPLAVSEHAGSSLPWYITFSFSRMLLSFSLLGTALQFLEDLPE